MNTLLKIGAVLVALAGSAAADLIEQDVSHLRLRSQSRVQGAIVTLADVLVFAEADPRLLPEIGDKPVVDRLVPPTVTEVTHDQVAARLGELGVNLARVLIDGALACRVTAEPVAVESAPSGASTNAPLIGTRLVSSDTNTLAELLRSQLETELAAEGGTVEVDFEQAGQEFLALTTPPFDFSVRGGHGAKLGLREFSVTIRRDGRVQRTVRIGANVKLVKQVLVAAKPLNVGAYVKQDSLGYATRIFSSGDDLGLEHPEQVVGQRVKSFVPAGQMLAAHDLQAVDLIKRSQPVTVIGGGAVSLRVTGDALDSGGYGDTIRVRLGDSRKNRREVRGIVTGVGTVQLAEEGLER
jgi:flagella basal body P-ring formation protein FlgA